MVTGGSGLVGQYLVDLLHQTGYQVHLLSRSSRSSEKFTGFRWDLNNSFIEEAAFEGVQAIVHLAGAGVADKRWTDSRKREIIDSRVKSAGLMFDFLSQKNHQVDTFISASAMGIYGNKGSQMVSEADDFGDDFLAEVCIQWEAAAAEFEKLDIRTSMIRISLVLDKKQGALPQMALPVNFGVKAGFGTGKQMTSWIHARDLAKAILFILENESCTGPYNAAAPEALSNTAFMQAIGAAKNRNLISFNIPKSILNLVFGELSQALLQDVAISPAKLIEAGFEFEFPTLKLALKDIYS